MQDLSDEELVTLSMSEAVHSARQREAMDELFRRYQTRVALWCWRVTSDRDWASDLAQEVFLKAFRNLASFRSESKFSTWLYTIARNHCFNAVQSRAVRAEEQPLEFDIVPDTLRVPVDQQLESEQEIRIMKELINGALDETERQVMTLHYGEDMTLASISGLLNLQNASGAKAYIVSAKRKLQAAIQRMKARNVRGERAQGGNPGVENQR
jgi:RNA polymerase sigma-70 factor, ECF subfamily